MTDEQEEDLRDKNPLSGLVLYSVRIDPETKRRIDIINGYKDGLTDKVRQAIDGVVNPQWEKLQKQLENKSA